MQRLADNSFTAILPPYLKAKHTVICLRLDDLVYQNMCAKNMKEKVEREQTWVKVQDVSKFLRSNTVKLTFCSSEMTLRAWNECLLMFSISIPPHQTQEERYTPLLTSNKCYAVDHSTTLQLFVQESILAKAMLDLIPVDGEPKEDHKYVIDGGALLHRIPWQLGDCYDKILERYCGYVTKRYGRAAVVFDGYLDGPSTKDVAHDRRLKGKCGRKVSFQGSMSLQMKKEEFLANVENKARFLKLLGEKLEGCGCDVSYARADADLLIVETAVKMSDNTDVVLVGDDTDLLVLLCYHVKNFVHDTFFLSEPKQTSTQPRRFVSIKTLKDALGRTVCNHILFAHAFLGCDTTSRVYGIGKAVSLKMLREGNGDIAKHAEVFGNPGSTGDDIAQAGEKAMVAIYKGRPSDALDSLRFLKFKEKLSSSKTFVHPRVLPPTSDGNRYHSYRVYHQVQQWRGNDLDPEKWGWRIVNGKLVPKQTELPAAPQSLLELVRCSCKTGCNDLRCGCRKQGLSCSLSCTACRGVCANSDNVEEDSDET